MPLIEFENFVDIGISIGINYSVNVIHLQKQGPAKAVN